MKVGRTYGERWPEKFVQRSFIKGQSLNRLPTRDFFVKTQGTGSTFSRLTSFFDFTDSTESNASLVAKEHFVFTDPEGQLYHFSVEGNAIKDGTKIPAEANLCNKFRVKTD